MKHEKIIRRPDGSRVKIKTRLSVDFGDRFHWSREVLTCEKGKRIFKPCVDTDSLEFRKLGPKERCEYLKAKQEEIATLEEFREAKWELLKILEKGGEE